MNDNREAYLEKQINLYAKLIDELECSRRNFKQRKDLQNFQDLYKKYIGEYKDLLIKQQLV